MALYDRTTSVRGSSTKISLNNSRWSENTINTHKYKTIYWSSNRSYYNLGSCISYTKEVWSQNHASGDKSEFAEAISLNDQNILFALEKNDIHRRSKPEDASMESNPHRFELPIDNPHRHRQKEEAVTHLHIEDNKSKACVTPWFLQGNKNFRESFLYRSLCLLHSFRCIFYCVMKCSRVFCFTCRSHS
jgi:hypothetical protein